MLTISVDKWVFHTPATPLPRACRFSFLAPSISDATAPSNPSTHPTLTLSPWTSLPYCSTFMSSHSSPSFLSTLQSVDLSALLLYIHECPPPLPLHIFSHFQSVDLSALLLYIHEFFDALGPEELRKRGAREDKPVRGGGEAGGRRSTSPRSCARGERERTSRVGGHAGSR